MKTAACALAAIMVLTLSPMAPPAVAQDNYPASPVRVVVVFPPGGTTDVIARLLSPKLSAQMNANVFVENKPGANGNIGAHFVARSKPDGYTLLYHTSGLILSPALGKKVNYDILRDLAPVALVTSVPLVLLVHPSLPANTVAEFSAYLKSNPDKLAYGSAGTGNINHLAAVLFLQANGLSALHVPYKGSGPMLLDAVAGRVQFVMQTMAAILPLVKDKRMRALAITSLKRSPLLPDVPALNETMPGFEIGAWHGVMVPAKTPAAIVMRLNREIVRALEDPAMRARLAQEGAEPVGSAPDEYGAYLKSELERWTKLIKTAGIKAE